MASDEQTRTAPRTAAGRALWGSAWSQRPDLLAAILAIEAEAAASREVPPEPPRDQYESCVCGRTPSEPQVCFDIYGDYRAGHAAAPSPEPVAAPPALREAAQAVLDHVQPQTGEPPLIPWGLLDDLAAALRAEPE